MKYFILKYQYNFIYYYQRIKGKWSNRGKELRLFLRLVGVAIEKKELWMALDYGQPTYIYVREIWYLYLMAYQLLWLI